MNIAKVDIFGNAKKANAEIVIRNHEESIVIRNHEDLKKNWCFSLLFVRILNRIARVKKFSYTQTYSIS